MPFVVVRTSTPITPRQEEQLKAAIGGAIARIPGKSEQGLLVGFEDSCRLWLAGESDQSINMEGFRLFAPDRRTSLPLCLAYEAVAAHVPQRAAQFLYRLRYATVVECRPTTKLDELVRVAQAVGITDESFLSAYHGPEAQDLLYRDLALKERLGIYGLPAFVVEFEGRAALLSGIPSYQQLEEAIIHAGGGSVRPRETQATAEALGALLDRHPLISFTEVAAAFDLTSDSAVDLLAEPLITTGKARLARAPKGRFLAGPCEEQDDTGA